MAEAGCFLLGGDVSMRAGAELGRSISSTIDVEISVLRRPSGGVPGRGTCANHRRTDDLGEGLGDCSRRCFFGGAQSGSGSSKAPLRLGVSCDGGLLGQLLGY